MDARKKFTDARKKFTDARNKLANAKKRYVGAHQLGWACALRPRRGENPVP